MSDWNWLKDGVGGAADWVTGGFTDFDQKGNSINWGQTGSPIFGGSDKKWGPEPEPFNFVDAMQAFTKGYSSTMDGMGYGGPTSGGSSFLNAYTSGKGATPTSSSPVSTSSAFTAGGKTHTMPGIVINEPVDFYAFKDNVQYPTQQGGSGGSKGGGLLDTVAKGVGIAGGLKAAFPATFAFLCDIRTKTDISPLKTTEINDELAQAAFFVKELRECS